MEFPDDELHRAMHDIENHLRACIEGGCDYPPEPKGKPHPANWGWIKVRIQSVFPSKLVGGRNRTVDAVVKEFEKFSSVMKRLQEESKED